MASGLRRLRKVTPQAPPPETHGRLVVLPLREGTQAVAVLSPAGELLREVGVPGAAPGKLCFGGPDSRTVYVKAVTKQRLVQFRADRPGLAAVTEKGGTDEVR